MILSVLENTKLKMKKNILLSESILSLRFVGNNAKLIGAAQMCSMFYVAPDFKSSHLPRRIALFVIVVCWFFLSNKGNVFWVSEYSIFLHLWLRFFSVRGLKSVKVHYQRSYRVLALCRLLWKLVQDFYFYSEWIYSWRVLSRVWYYLETLKGAAFLLLICLFRYGWLCWSLVLEGPWWVAVAVRRGNDSCCGYLTLCFESMSKGIWLSLKANLWACFLLGCSELQLH